MPRSIPGGGGGGSEQRQAVVPVVSAQQAYLQALLEVSLWAASGLPEQRVRLQEGLQEPLPLEPQQQRFSSEFRF